MGRAIDHFVWGVPDLESGCAAIESLFGVAPEPGGSHPGLGTCNALLGLGPGLYLEVMAPYNPSSGSIGERLANLMAPGLVTWVIRSGALGALSQSVIDQQLGAVPRGPVKTERVTPQGERLAWELLFLTQHEYGGLVPFFIDWQATRHPSETAPQAGALLSLEIGTKEAKALNALLSGVGATQTATGQSEDQLTVRFDTKLGDVVLQSTPQSLAVLDG